MAKEPNSEQIDPDIAECKRDILRAGGADAAGDGKGRSVPKTGNKQKARENSDISSGGDLTNSGGLARKALPFESTALSAASSKSNIEHRPSVPIKTAGAGGPKVVSSDRTPALRDTAKPGGLTVKPDEPAGKKQQQTSEIPRFDLAEDIMAQQRKLVALRRKAPPKPQAGPQEQFTGRQNRDQLYLSTADQQQIIVEIVARDIERMCRGDYIEQPA
ncbi:MAG TPA: hypothetical protein VMW23_06050 [Sedimentisphaerales bacterium]|nr:hypothetical protein [Sedimentisphaerales bacterium]